MIIRTEDHIRIIFPYLIMFYRYFEYRAPYRKDNAFVKYYDSEERKLERLQFFGIIPNKKDLLEILERNE